jgi:hypothetical protein
MYVKPRQVQISAQYRWLCEDGRPCDVFVFFEMEAAPRYDGPTSSNGIYNRDLMSELIVIGYNDQFKAEEARIKFIKMQRDYLVD